ncbi:MAG: lamin tail domain-containing protein [Pirellulales bacterium]
MARRFIAKALRRNSRKHNRPSLKNSSWILPAAGRSAFAPRAFRLEQLEPRTMLAADLMISEFMASNTAALDDVDGDASDWIEIYNAGTTATSLDNWYLTDSANPTKWAFPDQTIQGGEYLVVFASGKNRAVAGQELHTNFQMAAGGEYLALVYDDPVTGLEAVSEFDPTLQKTNISYGYEQTFTGTTLIGPTAAVNAHVPADGSLGTTWTAADFVPTGWLSGSGGVGFDQGTNYDDDIGLDLGGSMLNQNASAYIRYPFAGVDPSTVDRLTMQINHDDGYLAYLNGTLVDSRLAPVSPTFDSTATSENGGSIVVIDKNDFSSMAGMSMVGSTTVSGAGANARLRLTSTAGSLAGAAWKTSSAPFGEDFSFSTNFTIEVHTPGGSSDADGLGADGMTFVIQAAGSSAIGSAGGGLGLDGIAPFVAVEFDTWVTGSYDPAGGTFGTHIGIDTSVVGSVTRVAVPRFNGPCAGCTPPNDPAHGGPRYVWVDYNGETDQMQVYFSTTATKPGSATMTATVDLASIFGATNEQWIGFTAGTGGATNTHDVLNWEFTSGLGELGLTPRTVDLSIFIDQLLPTGNVLAFHGLNVTSSNGDFFIRPELTATTINPIDRSDPLYFISSSPGGPNGIGSALPSDPVVFSRPSGIFTDNFTLTLTGPAGSEIYYTTNDTDPTLASTHGPSPVTINISATTRLRARSQSPGQGLSETLDAYYIGVDSTLANFKSSMPIVILDTFNVGGANPINLGATSPGTMAAAVFIEQGADGATDITDPADYAGRGSLRLRGQTSQGMPKRPFAFETWDIANADKDVSLLGLPEESDWVFMNPYSEKPLMQNYLNYKWSNDMGTYATRPIMVEVFVNGDGDGKINYDEDYAGVYVFTEKIKIGPDRIDITELDPSDSTYPAISGGYVWKKDKVASGGVRLINPGGASDGSDFGSNYGTQTEIVEPDDSVITNAQANWLQAYLAEFIGVFNGPDWNDPVNGYAKYIDVQSWIDHWIIVEMTKNIDGFRLSTYWYKDRDKVDPQSGDLLERGKMQMIVWDANLSMGNADYLQGALANTWYHSQSATFNGSGLSNDEYPFWRKLFTDPEFKQALVDRWQELRRTVFTNEKMLGDMDAMAAQMLTAHNWDATRGANPIDRNFQEFHTLGCDTWPNSYFSAPGTRMPYTPADGGCVSGVTTAGLPVHTWQNDYNFMRNTFFAARLAWMDSQLGPAGPTFSQNGGAVPEGYPLSMSAPAGTIYYTTDGTDPRTAAQVIPGTPPTTILPSFSPVKYLVPSAADAVRDSTWMNRTFSDASWTSGQTALGYDNDTAVDYNPQIRTNMLPAMEDLNVVYIRVPFNVADPAQVNRLLLEMNYDDGFVAYLNDNTIVARSPNFTAAPGWNSVPGSTHEATMPSGFEEFDITAFRNKLVTGTNILAIHGMNQVNTSSDFFIMPEIRINGTADTIIPGGIAPTAVQYTGPVTINDNTRVTARVRTATGDWSGDLAHTFFTDLPPLRVSEINYNPSPPTPAEVLAGFNDNEMFEFIEIENIGSEAIDITGASLTTGVTFTFAGTLDPGERTVAVKNVAAFQARYGSGINVAGVYSGNLSNDGEQIVLLGPIGEPIHDFTYSDEWYPLTDGDGYALVSADTSQLLTQWNQASGWRTGYYQNGSPGSADPGTPSPRGSITINEVLAYTASAEGERIELHNTTGAPIDVSGWYLSDDPLDLTKYLLPTLPEIPGGGFLVLDESTYFGAEFSLSPQSGRLVLNEADASGDLVGFQTSVSYDGSALEMTQGRYVKPDGSSDFVPQTANTLGAANAAPVIGPIVVNEVHYNPTVIGGEWLELYNISGAPVDVEGWTFTAGVDYTFGDLEIPAGGYVIVAESLTTFAAEYNVPPGTPVVGPYVGSLDNNGDDLRLSRPGDIGQFILVDRVGYDDEAPWPTTPDGNGQSLSKISSPVYGNYAPHWSAGIIDGTPGAANTLYDESPPTVPIGLSATVAAGPAVTISWAASTEPDSSILHYVVRRNNNVLGTTTSTSFTDNTAAMNTLYNYDVIAVNTSGVGSAASTDLPVRVFDIASVAKIDANHIRVTFREAVNASGANPANYFIGGLTVTGAVLEAPATQVLLTTAETIVDGQPYRITVNHITGAAAGSMMVSNTQFVMTPGVFSGLLGSYYSYTTTPDFTNFVFERVDPIIDFTWSTTPDDPRVGPERFSVRWLGKIQAELTQNYTFRTTTSDGIRLWLDLNNDGVFNDDTSERIIQNWTTHGTTNNFGTASLVAGQKYNIKIDYYEVTGTARMLLSWGSSQTSQTTVPTSRLFTPTALETTPPAATALRVAGSDWSAGFRGALTDIGQGPEGYAVPLGGESDVLPWSNVDTVSIDFDSDVNVAQGDLAVSGVVNGGYAISGFSYDHTTYRATWTLAQPLPTDYLTISLASTVKDLAGNPVTGATSASARVLVGDVDQNASVNDADFFGNLRRQFTGIGHANYSALHDVDANGAINAIDWLMIRDRRGQSVPVPSPSASPAVASDADRAVRTSTESTLRAGVLRRTTGNQRTLATAAIDRVLTVDEPATRVLRARRNVRPIDRAGQADLADEAFRD